MCKVSLPNSMQNHVSLEIYFYHKYINIFTELLRPIRKDTNVSNHYNLYEPPTAFSMYFLGINAIAS